jgi:CcmD family protein
MTHVGYLALGYGATGVVLVAYAIRLLRRGRSLERQARPEDLPWRR